MPITRVTGAAVAADVAPDGAVWFLNLQSSGYDLRRIHPDSARIDASLPSIVLGDTLSSILPPRRRAITDRAAAAPPAAPSRTESGYGFGPTRFRYVPVASAGYGGSSAGLALVRSDPVGRLGVQFLGVGGCGGLPAGGSVTLTSRARRTVFGLSGWYSHEAPSRELPSAQEAGLDLVRGGGALRLDRRRVRASGELTGMLAALGEVQRPAAFEQAVRRAVIGAFGATAATGRRRRSIRPRARRTRRARCDRGRAIRASARQRCSSAPHAVIARCVTARLAYGTVGSGVGAAHERFVVGGFRSPLIDPVFDARRVDAPAYPIGSAAGLTFASYRVGIPIDPLEAFYSGATTDFFQSQRRSYGVELRQRFPVIAALGTPEANVVAGLARAQDEPVEGKWRFYLSLALRP